MTLHKHLLATGFALPNCEKHFHDSDESWLILAGSGTGYAIDPEGVRHDYRLEAGDVWMIEAGWEHGSDGPNSPDFRIAVCHGTVAPGARESGHLHMEHEGYLPRLHLERVPCARYHSAAAPASGPVRGAVHDGSGAHAAAADTSAAKGMR